MYFQKGKILIAALATLIVSFLLQPAMAQKKAPGHTAKQKLQQQDSIDIANKAELQDIQRAAMGDTLVPYLVNKVGKYTVTLHRSSHIVQQMIDLQEVYVTLKPISKAVDRNRKRLEAHGFQMNKQSLNSGLILLGESQSALSDLSETLAGYSKSLSESNASIRKIIADPVFVLPNISPDLRGQLQEIYRESLALDTAQRTALAKINLARNSVSIVSLKITDLISDMRYLEISSDRRMWQQEEPYLLAAKPKQYSQSLLSNIGTSLNRAPRVSRIYLHHKMGLQVFSVMLLIASAVLGTINLKKVKKEKKAIEKLHPVLIFSRSPILAMLFAFSVYVPFFFLNPPMPFLNLMEFLSLLVLGFLIWHLLPETSRVVWGIITGIWVYMAIDNLLLEPSWGERWFLFLAMLALIAICLWLFKNGRSAFGEMDKSPATYLVSAIAVSLGFISLVFNLLGRTTLAKLLAFTAIQTIVMGVILKVFCKTVLEFIYLQTESNRESRLSAFINYQELRNQYSRLLGFFAVIGWLICIIHGLGLYDFFLFGLNRVFVKPIQIGSMSFTFGSIGIFILVIWISSIVSRFVYFVLGHESDHTNNNKRNKIGTMALLVRLAIWILGFLIAMAAAGIPIDKVTIILSALGVGIGFGLQNIVNNLVSGVILAFERPIQIGDMIEVGGKTGTVKEIGVRSSKIKDLEGADIIVPNGNLLSQQLTNWTLTNRSKRIDFSLRVAYGTELETVKSIVAKVFEKIPSILQKPKPAVIVSDFGHSAIRLKIYFWTPEVMSAVGMRSKVMEEVYKAMQANHIEIPVDTGSD